jgi:hypothetical protein
MRAQLTQLIERELSHVPHGRRRNIRARVERMALRVAITACQEVRELSYDDVVTNGEIVELVQGLINDGAR